MPDKYGAAQPIVDAFQHITGPLVNAFGGGEAPAVAPPPPANDPRVAEATASFDHHTENQHIVHEIHRPQGHGYVDQKYGKGNRSPIGNSVPLVK